MLAGKTHNHLTCFTFCKLNYTMEIQAANFEGKGQLLRKPTSLIKRNTEFLEILWKARAISLSCYKQADLTMYRLLSKSDYLKIQSRRIKEKYCFGIFEENSKFQRH